MNMIASPTHVPSADGTKVTIAHDGIDVIDIYGTMYTVDRQGIPRGDRVFAIQE